MLSLVKVILFTLREELNQQIILEALFSEQRAKPNQYATAWLLAREFGSRVDEPGDLYCPDDAVLQGVSQMGVSHL